MRPLIVLLTCMAMAHLSQAKSLGQVLTRGIRSAETTTDTKSVPPSSAPETPKVDEVVSSQAPVEVSSPIPVTEQRVKTLSSTSLTPTETASESTGRSENADSAPMNAPVSRFPEAISLKAAMESAPEVKEALAPVLEAMKMIDEVLPSQPAPVSTFAPAPASVPAIAPVGSPVSNDITQNDSAMAKEAAEIIAEMVVNVPKVVPITNTKEGSAPSVEAKSTLEPPVEASVLKPVVAPIEAQTAPADDARPIIETALLALPADAEPPVEASMREPVVVHIGAPIVTQNDAKPVAQAAMPIPRVNIEPPVEASMPEAVIAPVETLDSKTVTAPVEISAPEAVISPAETSEPKAVIAPVDVLAPKVMMTDPQEKQASSSELVIVSPVAVEVPIEAARSDMIPAQEIYIDSITAAPATVELKMAPPEDTRTENQVDNAPAALEPKTESVPETPASTVGSSTEPAVASTSAANLSSTETQTNTENAAPSSSEAPATVTSADVVTASSTKKVASPTTLNPANYTGTPESA